MRIFETHAHYDDESFAEDRDALLKSFSEMGISPIVNIASDIKSLSAVRDLAAKYPYVYCTQGLHPSDSGDASEEIMEEIRQACLEDEKVVAIGEIGLDYHWPEPDHEHQKKWFRRQLRLALELRLPVVIHSREAAEDTIAILREVSGPSGPEAGSAAGRAAGNGEENDRLSGIIHCYSYGPEEAEDYLTLGFYFGIGGVLTFKNAKQLREALEIIPLSRIVLETDSPYLAPEPYRGKRNDSGKLPLVVSALAKLKGVSEEEVRKQTFQNAAHVYRLKGLW